MDVGMSTAFDTAYERMQGLAKLMAGDAGRNEAATRLQLIDRLLFECLGWSRDEATVEDHESGYYADYVLDRRARTLVVEAKKEGGWFELPLGLGRIMALPALYAIRGNLSDALKQVEKYAQRRGAPYATICNGHQLVAFIASRQDGTAPRDGKALVFSSPQDMLEDFALLWETLSPEGCGSRRLSRRLSAVSAVPPPKVSEQISDFPGQPGLNEREIMIGTLRSLFLPNYLRDDEQEDEFLQRCYSPPGAYSQLSALNKGVLRARYSQALGEELRVGLEAARDRDGLNPLLLEQVAATSADREPLVLLGDVGVGKTMFLRRLLRIDARELADDAVVVYVNFGGSAVLGDLREFVVGSIRSQLLERYGIDIDAGDFIRGTYQAEVKRFARSVDGPMAESEPAEFKRREIDHLRGLSEQPEEHIRRSFEHLVKLRRKQVVVVLDNIDQRRPEDQEQVFLMAETFALRWPCTVFVTLRPETFHASKISRALSGYQPRVFTIQPPRVERVVLARLRYGREHYAEHGRLPTWIGYTADSEDLSRYIDLLVKSFSRNHRLQAMLVQLSGGNTRRALELVSGFVTSPHGEATTTLDRTGDYVIPHHVFLRATLLGEAQYYDSTRSRIPNVFDLSTYDGREHFLAPCILGLLRRAADSRDQEGYVAAEEVFGACQDLSFTVEQIDYAIQRLVVGAFIDVLPPVDWDSVSTGAVHSVRITSVGIYGHRELPAEFQYLDAVVIDTPVADASVRGRLADVRSTRLRLERAEVFLSYLDNSWSAASLVESGLFDWDACSNDARNEVKAIKERL